ncbi:uncharacterized protein TNIN_432991 [Trichonephila inaurata madagascariensis]|uniref:Uncharacterized protein n=1 Tax=Trichonephila inaurata madagascariensis TaxID=2747483 RepID=A0A8X6MEF0_9ARAC|nr:uncharacterized protein TNIN_432991 [Trichonephila inaurata madagascariensis]
MSGQPFQKGRNGLIFSKENEVKMSEKATDVIYCYSKHSIMKEFSMIFKILQFMGINTFDRSNLKYGIPLRNTSARNTTQKGFNCIKVYTYFTLTLVCTKFFLNLLWVWLLPDKITELIRSFLAVILTLFYVSVYRRRRVFLRISECIIRIYRKLPHRNINRRQYLFIIFFAFIEIITTALSVMEIYSGKNITIIQKSAAELLLNSFGAELFYCFLLAHCVELLFYVITSTVLSVFTIYYGLTCEFVRDIIQQLLNKLKTNCFLQDVESLIDVYGDIENCMSYMDEKLSLPAFLLVVMNMSGLFWTSYKLVHLSDMNNYYFISLICFMIFHSSLQLLMIISASITNELATKMKHFVGRLPYIFPTRHQEIKFKLKQNLMQENYLTLWKTYVLDRSLAIASFGVLLTYGFLINNLREDS